MEYLKEPVEAPNGDLNGCLGQSLIESRQAR